jgi:hypothetical protein
MILTVARGEENSFGAILARVREAGRGPSTTCLASRSGHSAHDDGARVLSQPALPFHFCQVVPALHWAAITG